MIFVGESLSGAIATELATRHAGRLLVRHGAFTSFPDTAQTRFSCFPSRYLVHDRMNNEAKISKARCPVYITHGSADPVIPFRQGERLYEAAREPKRSLRISGMGHTHPVAAEFYAAVRAFLDDTRPWAAQPATSLSPSTSTRTSGSPPGFSSK